MILDERTEFCDDTSVILTAGASWQNVGDQIPLDVARDLGNGQPIYLVVAVGTDGIDAAGAGAFAVRLASDNSATIHASTSTVHIASASFVTATTSGDAGAALEPGKPLLIVALPMEGNAYETFLGIQVLVTTQDTTAGKINAFLTHDVAKWKAYADAI